MPRKNYEYTHIPNVNTLRLTLDFAKLYPIEVVEEAFFILSTKGRKKSEYIVKALDYYWDSGQVTREIKRSMQWIRMIKIIKEQFGLEDEKAIKQLITVGTDSPQYEIIEASIPTKVPAKMLCGFSMTDPRAVDTHKLLFEMSANERLMTVSNAVINYVLDGQDPDAEDHLAIKSVLDMIKGYEKCTDKEKTLNLYLALFNLA